MPMMVQFSWVHEASKSQARELVKAMRRAAVRLPFTMVSRVREDDWGHAQRMEGRRPRNARERKRELERHFRRWPGRWFVNRPEDDLFEMIHPVWTCYFEAQLEGCDPVTAGLAVHIPTVETEREWDGVVELPTGLDGKMAWQCKCETLHAGLPQNGGWKNFLKQHTTVLRFLEQVEKLGIEPQVWDQGKYWETTNENLLREEYDRSLKIVTATMGELKDRLARRGQKPDDDYHSALLRHPAFERLEAEGRAILGPEFDEIAGSGDAAEPEGADEDTPL